VIRHITREVADLKASVFSGVGVPPHLINPQSLDMRAAEQLFVAAASEAITREIANNPDIEKDHACRVMGMRKSDYDAAVRAYRSDGYKRSSRKRKRHWKRQVYLIIQKRKAGWVSNFASVYGHPSKEISVLIGHGKPRNGSASVCP